MLTPRCGRRPILAATLVMLMGITRLPAQRPTVVDLALPSDSMLSAYIGTLRFARDHVSSHLSPLNFANAPRELAWIEPEISQTDTLGRGRIVARIVNLGDDVRRFALLRGGKTYVWAQGDRRPGYAIYITTDAAGRIVHRAQVPLLEAMDHPPNFAVPMARWGFGVPDSTPSGFAKALAAVVCWNRCSMGPWCMADTIRSSAERR